MRNLIQFIRGGIGRQAVLWFAAAAVFLPSFALAHGERNQEPFLRLRTAHFYDVKWSTDKIKVNEDVVLTGRFRLSPDWPANLPAPEVVFLGNGTPGPVLVRTESYLNGVPAIQSARLQLDRDYEFKMVLKGRIPGRHHVHPMLNVSGAGPLVGPGAWITVEGNAADFRLPATTLTGHQIENLETWGTGTVYAWHLVWVALAAFWIVWWLRRPLLMPRYKALQAGAEDELVTTTDLKVGVGLMVLVIAIVYFGYQWAEAKYTRTVPLQGGQAKVDPLPETDKAVLVRVVRASYDVPGRSMKFEIDVTNGSDKPVVLGEFMTSNLRFVNRSVPAAVKLVDHNYPQELLPQSGLIVKGADSGVAAGETRRLQVEATDALWELERLTSMLNDPDNRIGGLLFFFDSDGKRIISNIMGPIVPLFTTPTL